MAAQYKRSKDTNQAVPRMTVRPAIRHEKSSSADLNKPLPVIQDMQRRSDLEGQSPQSQKPSSTNEDNPERSFSSQRNALRFTNSSYAPYSIESANAQDRTTVFIIYQGEDRGYGQAF
jgi:hypothetical protein